MKRNDSITLKLSNVLYHFDEFYNRCQSELDMTDLVNEGLNDAYDKWSDCLVDDEFIPSAFKDEAVEILEFCMDEFGYFKNIFDYTVEQILDLAPGMILEKYFEILPVLIEKYGLNSNDIVPVETVDNTDFGNIENSEVENIENHYFYPGEYFTLKPEWKDGNEGVYIVIEDREDKVLAEPTWITNMSILPQDVIRKNMILEIVDGPDNN